MKKMFKTMMVMLLVVLMLASSVSAYAASPVKPAAKDETKTEAKDGEVVELKWEEFEPVVKEQELKGDFYSLNSFPVQFWVTEVFEQVELADEDVKNGMLAMFSDDEGDYGFFVTYFENEGMSLEEYAKEIAKDDTYTDLETLKVNGLDAIAFSEYDKELDEEFEYVVFTTTDGYFLTFTYGDTSDEDYMNMAIIMIASIQPAETKK